MARKPDCRRKINRNKPLCRAKRAKKAIKCAKKVAKRAVRRATSWRPYNRSAKQSSTVSPKLASPAAKAMIAAIKPGTILVDSDWHHPSFVQVIRKTPASFVVKPCQKQGTRKGQYFGSGGADVASTCDGAPKTLRYKIFTSAYDDKPQMYGRAGGSWSAKFWRVWDGKPVEYDDYMD